MNSSKYLPALRQYRQNTIEKLATRGERLLGALFPSKGAGWPGGWSADRLEQVLHFKNWTYVCIDTIACKLASLIPNLAYVVDAPKPGISTKACQRGLMNLQGNGFGGSHSFSHGGHTFLTIGEYQSKALSVIKPHEELEPLENDHPLRRLIENPNVVDTYFDLTYELNMFEELCGVSYEWLPPNKWGVPCERWCMPSHWVWPKTGGGLYVSPDNPHADELIQYFEIRPWGGMGSAGMLRIPPNEMIMHTWKSPINKIDGYAKLSAANQWIDTEESIGKSRWSQMQNVARPEFWVELGAGFEDVTDDRIARVEAKIASKLQGEYNYGKPLITPPGAKVTPLSFNPTEMAYFQCCSADTECLTDNGWKKYTELDNTSRIACYNQGTGEIEYHNPSRVVVKDYNGPMHHWHSRDTDVLVTPEHRMLVRVFDKAGNPTTEHGLDWTTMRMQELPAGRHFRIKNSAPASGKHPEVIRLPKYRKWAKGGSGYSEPEGIYELSPELWVKFIGWYVSEGHLTKDRPRVTISQKIDSPHTPEINQLIRQLFPWEWAKNVCGGKDNRGCYQWYSTNKGLYQHLKENCGKTAREKRLPRYVMSWSSELLRGLFDAAIAGDGKDCGVDKFGNHHWEYHTLSPKLAEDMAEIGIKCGLRSTIVRSRMALNEDGSPGYYTICFCDKTYSNVHSEHQTVVSYEGKIWCVTVPTGLFVVRRNGKVHITGNSEDQIRDMLLSVWRIPPAAVGLVKDMTYGSLLASLATLCEYCLNPRLVKRGLTLTKHLAKRWDEPGRRVRIWWDNCVPADPTQVNADLAEDRNHYAISVNEVRALRGRKAFLSVQADNPMCQGAGGIMPLPINIEEDLTDLAALIKPMTAAEDPKMGLEEEKVGLEKDKVNAAAGKEDTNAEEEGTKKPKDALKPAGIAKPNSQSDEPITKPTAKEIADWDEWFGLPGVNLTKRWEAVKALVSLTKAVEWAQWSELERATLAHARKKIRRQEICKESFFETCDRDDKGHCKPGPGGVAVADKLPSSLGKKPAAKRSEMQSVKREGTGKDARIVMEDGSPAPNHIKPSMVPPALTDAKIAIDPKAEVLVTGKVKGRPYTCYSDSFHMRNAALKFARVMEMVNKDQEIFEQNQNNRQDLKLKENADCVWLMDFQATRPGSDKDTKGVQQYLGRPMSPDMVVDKGKGKVALQVDGKTIPIKDSKTGAEILRRKAAGEDLYDTNYWLNSYGATTLEPRHVVEAGDGIHIQFVGKEGVWHDHLIADPDLANMLVQRKQAGKDKLFDTTYEKVGEYSRKQLDSGRFTPKDFRTKRANLLATKLIKDVPAPKDSKEYKKAVLGVAERVSRVLGNRPAQALESYINPSIFGGWKELANA